MHLQGSFMATVAATLLAYVNDLNKADSRVSRVAESTLSLVFGYNLAIVALGILVPQLRRHWRGKEAFNAPMLLISWSALFCGLFGMTVAFCCIIFLKLGSIIGGIFTGVFVVILIGGSILGVEG